MLKNLIRSYPKHAAIVFGIIAAGTQVILPVGAMINFCGLIFGLSSALYFWYLTPERISLWKYIGWICISGISWYIGMMLAIWALAIAEEITGFGSLPYAFASGCGGIAGVLILMFPLMAFVGRLRKSQVYMLLIGAFLIPFVVTMPFGNLTRLGDDGNLFFYTLWLFWEPAILFLLYWAFQEQLVPTESENQSKKFRWFVLAGLALLIVFVGSMILPIPIYILVGIAILIVLGVSKIFPIPI